VSPEWVLTAKHCFGDAGNSYWKSDDGWVVHFHEHPNSSNATEQRRNIAAPAILYFGPNVQDGKTDDLALVRVWPRVPGALAWPRSLPGVGQCPSDLTGQFIGYASSGPVHGQATDEIAWIFDDWCTVQDPAETSVRRESFHHDYIRLPTFGNAYYYKDYKQCTGHDLCTWYTGGAWFGDSGGPLLHGSKVCGVMSRVWWITGPEPWSCPIPIPAFHVFNEFTATDSPDAAAWLSATLAHPTFPGLLKGQCPPFPSWSEDVDRDGVHDDCDDCPTVFNPEQNEESALPGYDADLDGIGNACDTCPGIRQLTGTQKANSNFEAEWAKFRIEHENELGYPPEAITGERVRIRRNYYLQAEDFDQTTVGPAMAFAKELAAGIFRADVCDPNPSVTVSLSKNGTAGSLAGLPWPTDPLVCGSPGASCNFDEVTKVRFAVSDSTIIPAGTFTGDVGLRWCQCHDQDTNTLNGRMECEEGPSNCVKIASHYNNPLSSWKPIQTFADYAPAQLASGAEFSHTFGWILNLDGHDRTNWDFRNLPWYEKFGPDPNNPEEWRVKGVLWATWMASQVPSGIDGDLRHGWGHGNAYYRFNHQMSAMKWTELELFCWFCDWSVLPVLDDLVNPSGYQVLSDGGAVDGPQSDGYDLLAAAVAAGEARVISFGDKHEISTLPEQATIGLTLEPETGMPLHFWKAGEQGAAPEVVELGGEWGEVPEIFPNDAAMVLSARHQVAVVAGGTFDGTAESSPVPYAWMLDLRRGTWSALPEVDGEIGHVLGATYSAVDEAMWFVRVREEGQVVISRWSFLVPSIGVQHMAMVPASWGTITGAYLLAEGDGTLVIALRLAGGTTRAALFTDLRTTPLYRGALDTTLAVARSPLAGRGGILLFGDAEDGPTMEQYTLEDFRLENAPPLEAL
jgi:hypothetical protein